MSIFLPPESNYARATREMRSRNGHREWLASFSRIAFIALCLFACFAIPGVLYWIVEIGGSLVLDALAYIILPFFGFGIGLAIGRNWQAILQALKEAFLDMLDILLMR